MESLPCNCSAFINHQCLIFLPKTSSTSSLIAGSGQGIVVCGYEVKFKKHVICDFLDTCLTEPWCSLEKGVPKLQFLKVHIQLHFCAQANSAEEPMFTLRMLSGCHFSKQLYFWMCKYAGMSRKMVTTSQKKLRILEDISNKAFEK